MQLGEERVYSISMKRAVLAIAILLSSAILCYAIDIGELPLLDGVYTASSSFVTVAVTVKDGKMTKIEIVKHGGGGEKYANMVRPLLQEMIEKQSTEVDSVTGATVSSENLKKAVEDAVLLSMAVH